MIPFIAFIVCPVLFFIILILGVVIARGHPGYSIIISIILISVWIGVGLLLMFLSMKGYIGCNIVTNLLGGCVC